MTVKEAADAAYREYERHVPKGEGCTPEAAAKALPILKTLLAQVEREPDPADFDDNEQAMFLYGTGRF
ncbi:MAG: hypothetical protein IPM52_14550 [Bacteroidetes bacterium]|nr:hypothetical protein [Bacteroidota bacterium]